MSRFTSLALVLVAGCAVKPPEEVVEQMKVDAKGITLSPDAPQWRYVELAVAQRSPSLEPLPIPARVTLDEKRTANVGAPLPGRVEQVAVRLGSRVKLGDQLFSVRSGAFAELDREKEAARAQVVVRQRLLDRAKELLELRAAAQKDVLTAEAELVEAELTLKAAASKLRSLQVTSAGDNLFWVKAARAGTIVDLDVYLGQEVTPDRDKPLLQLSDLDEVLVVADVPEADVGDLSIGEAVSIRASAGSTPRDGVIEYISEVVDPRRRTVEVRARAKNADRFLRPNAFVEVVATPDPSLSVVRVPDAAVVTQGTRSVIFVSNGPGRLEPVAVTTGRRRDGVTEVRRGLEENQRFVAKGALLLLNQVELASGT
ncbi:MAG: efflux RND transporter periplasmic adaptor subunit [Myxococcaceae bacterium]|nr:efflux RND transporter periplasmic adaptor subunit [Myxococcaceae bacterium]